MLKLNIPDQQIFMRKTDCWKPHKNPIQIVIIDI